MNIENKFARFMRNSGPARFFVPAGIILIVFGILTLGFNTDNFEKTVGTITSVTEVPRTDTDEAVQYDVGFRYTVDGREYDGTFPNLGGKFAVGGDIDVFYDPDNPETTTNGKMSKLFSPILIVLGIAALGFGVFGTVKAFKKSAELDAGPEFPSAAFETFKTAPGVTEVYFRFDGDHLKPGYVVEDADRKVIFEGKMTKNNPIGARLFEFRNHLTGSTAEHEVGHTVTATQGNEFFSVKSSFKFDGRDVWDTLHDKGLRLRTDLRSKFPRMTYDAARNGAAFAKIETSSIYIHEDEEAAHAAAIPAGSMYYRVWTNSNDFDTLFLTVFAISETEQAIVE